MARVREEINHFEEEELYILNDNQNNLQKFNPKNTFNNFEEFFQPAGLFLPARLL